MKFSIILLRPGKVPVVKGPWMDTDAGFRAHYDAVVELRKLNPDATIIPLTVRQGGEVWAEYEADFLRLEPHLRRDDQPANKTGDQFRGQSAP
jgi:hypothetical protein